MIKAMKEKKQLLKRIEAAVQNEKTAPDNKELLKELKSELEKAETKSQYWDIAVKIANIIGTVAKIFSG